MEKIMKKLRYAAALVAGMFALGVQAETYYLTRGQPLEDRAGDNKNVSSIAGPESKTGYKDGKNGTHYAAGWSTDINGTATKFAIEDAENTYIIPADDNYGGRDLRTKTDVSENQEFHDKNIVELRGGCIQLKLNSDKYLKIPHLIAKAPYTTSYFNHGTGGRTYLLYGSDWEIEDGAMLTFEADSDNAARIFKIYSKITGLGTLRLYANYASTIGKNNDFYLEGDFSEFKGDINIDACALTHVYVNGANAFGDNSGSGSILINNVKASGKTTQDGSTITFNNNITTGSQRRWNFGSESRGNKNPLPTTISVKAKYTLEIQGPVSGAHGLLIRRDSGLSGTVKFTHPNLEHYTKAKEFTGTTSQTISADDLSLMSDIIDHWAPFVATNCVWDGTTLNLVLQRGIHRASAVSVAYSDSEDGATIEWDKCTRVSLPVSFADGVTNLDAAVTPPPRTRFVRFHNDIDGIDGWSNVVDMNDLVAEVDPQVKLAALVATGTSIVGANLSVNLTGLGTGAERADVFAVYAHDDYAYTNTVATGVTELGTLPFAFTNLVPATTYQVYVFATNGLEGGFCRFPEEGAIIFSTLAEGTGDKKLPTTRGSWDSGAGWPQDLSNEGNLILGKQPKVYENKYTDGVNFSDSAATDGKFPKSSASDADGKYFGVGASCVASWVIDRPSSITSVRFFTPSVSGHGWIDITKVTATVDGGEVDLSSGYVLVQSHGAYATLDAPTGMALANLATAVTVYFAQNTGNNGQGYYSEIEAIGFDSGFQKLLQVADYIWDGTTLTAMLSREGNEASDVYACYGSTYGNDLTNKWEHCKKVCVFPANVAVNAAALAVPAGTRYVRFYSEKDGWTAVYLMSELAQKQSALPMFSASVRQVRATTASFTGTLAAFGEGASHIDILARYGADADHLGEATVVASIDSDNFDLTEAIPLELYDFVPDSSYCVQFCASNEKDAVSEWTTFNIMTTSRGAIDATVEVPPSDDSTAYVQCETRDLTATGERVLIFSGTSENNDTTPAPAILHVATPGYAEVLVVGGGGAGACNGNSSQSGGGGGAGGYQHFGAMYFESGDYSIVVGPGGIGGTGSGAHGRSSSIAFGNTVLVEARGGMGGFRDGDSNNPSLSGYASGGGLFDTTVWRYEGIAGQGSAGGKGNDIGGGGGGGAGAQGGDAAVVDGVKMAGNGGDGLFCDITGEMRYYAGGGGGAGAGDDVVAGAGGHGGGGSGTCGTTTDSYAARLTRNGVNGTGGGGGAGGNNVNPAGNGGSGTVILRFIPAVSALDTMPVVQLNALASVNDANNVPGVDVSYRVCSEGSGRFVKVDFEYGTDGIEFGYKVPFAEEAVVDNYERNVTGFRANVTYYGRMKITDEKGGVGYSRILQFTTLAGDDSTVEPTAPRFGAITYGTTNSSHKVEITAKGTNFALDNGKSTTVKLFVGTDQITLIEKEVTVVSVSGDEVTLYCDAIDFDTICYATLLVDNGDFATMSQSFSFAVPGRSVLLSSSAAPTQNKIVFSGVVKALGAGETRAKLYVSTVNAGSLELVAEIPITQTGSFSFEPVEFGWEETVYYRIDLENSFLEKKWSSVGAVANTVIHDAAIYTWNSEKNGGLWHDAANWTVEGAARGCPMRFATAKFPSGTSSENMVESEITVDRDQEVGFVNWGFSYGMVTFTGTGTTLPDVKMPDVNRPFNFNGGTYANVILDHIKMRGVGGNDHVTFGNYNTLTLKNGAVMADFGGGSQLNLSGTSNCLTITDGSRVSLANATHTLSGTDSRIEVLNGGTLEQLVNNSSLNLTGTGTALVIMNGTFNTAYPVKFTGNNTSSAKIVLAGETPAFTGAGAITADNNVTGRIEFMVPVSGYANVPLVRSCDLNASTGTGKITLAVPTDAPTATAETDLTVTLISATSITTDKFTLAELPHPDTDKWIWTKADGKEAGEGDTVTGLKVHLVGRPSEHTAPVARGLHVKTSTENSVTFEADFRRGGSSTSATWFYKVDDAAEWTAIDGTFNQVENVKELSIDGLEKGTQHALHLKGVSADNIENVIDYAFGTVGAVAELGTASGVAAETFGPYKRFVANASAKGTFVVLVAHAAEITFGDGTPQSFTLNTGTYTIDGLTLANEGGVLYAAPANAESMVIKVQTAEVKNEPSFGVAGLAVNAAGKVVVSLDVMGFGGELTREPDDPVTSFGAKLVWGYLPDHLVYECDLGAVSTLGTVTGTPLDLPVSTLIYAKVVCDNGETDGSAESDVFAYTIPGAGDEGDGALYQATATDAWKTDAWNILDDATCQTRGPMAAICGNTAGTGNNTWKDIGGDDCDNWKDNTTFGYVGYMKIDSTTISFGGGIDDNCVIKIFPQNTALTDLTTVEPLFTSGDFSGNGWHTSVCDTLPKAGWYPVEIRVGNAVGSYGPYNSTTYRLRYNLTGATDVNSTDWKLMLDSGDGSLFSTFAPKGDAPKFDESAPFVSALALDASAGIALDAVFTAENAATYAFRTAATEDMSGAVLMVAEATAGEDGKTTLTLAERVPGEAFYVQVVAYAAEGEKCFATYPRLVTMPTAAMFTTEPTVTSDQNTLTVTGSVLPGAGEAWVIGEFTVGDGEPQTIELAHWVAGAGKTYTLNWSQAFENAWDQSIAYKITLKNSVVGTDYEWTAVPVSGSQAITDGATYTWTGASEAEGAKLWNDAANWTSDKETGVGYPTANSVASFTKVEALDVALDQDRTVKDLTIGTGARVVFSGKHTFTLAKDLTLNAPRVTFGAVNEATVRIVGTFTANKANITNVVDNATLHVNSFKVNDSNYTLLISGAAPQIISRGHFGVCKGYTGANIQLTVPEGGWTQPVIDCNGLTTADKKFGYTDQDDSTASFAFVVDPASPFLEHGIMKTMVVVKCLFGFSVENMKFDANGEPVIVCSSPRVTECSLAFSDDDPAEAVELRLTLCGPMYAQIGDVQYATLAEAIAAVEDGETIKLLDDLALAEQVKVEDKSFVLDLGGKTVTFDGCDGFYFVGGEVAVTNGTVTMDVPATDNKFAAIGFEDAVGLVKDVVVNVGNAKDGVVCCSAGNDFNGKTVVCENVDVTGAGRNFYAETAAMTLDKDCSAVQSGHFAGGDAHSDALAAGWLGRLTVNGGTYSADVNVVGTMSSPATITLNAGTFTGTVNVIPVDPSYVAMGEHNITKDDAVVLAAPDGYKWDAKGKLVVKVPVAEYKGEQYYSVEEAMEAAAKDPEPGAITIIADSSEEISGEVKDFDSSKEVVFVKENEEVVPVVQTSTAVMQEVAAGGKALTANTPKLRAFLTENEIKAYTADHTTAAAISAALAAVPTTVEGNNGLELWKDYALGIEPTTPVKAVPPATDTATDGITLEIPALKTSEGSGDFTIKYQVIDNGSKDLKSEAESADAIKIPLETGVYDVKIVFGIQEP